MTGLLKALQIQTEHAMHPVASLQNSIELKPVRFQVDVDGNTSLLHRLDVKKKRT